MKQTEIFFTDTFYLALHRHYDSSSLWCYG